MTHDEALLFFHSAFVAFPGLSQWLSAICDKNGNSDVATLSVWERTLSKTTYADAAHALNGWIDGTIPNPPVGFEREQFALNVRQIAMRFSDDRNKALHREEQWKKTNRGNYQPSAALKSIFKSFCQILDLIERRNVGTLLQCELDAQVAEIVNEFGSRP